MSGHLSSTLTIALMFALPKKDRDCGGPFAFRPLSMLTTDYKILSGALAVRLLPHFPDIIHQDQSGFISHAGHRGSDDDNQSAMNLFIDIETAFDSFMWDYLFITMSRMGLGSFME